MTVVSFYEVDYSYDQEYLTGSLERCRSLLQELIKPHLTDKSLQRCDQVFDFLAYPKFLDSVFRYDSEYRSILGMLVNDLNKALDARRLWFLKYEIYITLIGANCRSITRWLNYWMDDHLFRQGQFHDRDRWHVNRKWRDWIDRTRVLELYFTTIIRQEYSLLGNVNTFSMMTT